MFFPALVFLAIRQVARLQALPYPLHDFAGAFLAAAPSFDRDLQYAGPLITARVKKPSPTVPAALDHQFVLLVNLSKVSPNQPRRDEARRIAVNIANPPDSLLANGAIFSSACWLGCATGASSSDGIGF
jgi:hypothetical protein